MTCTPTSSHNDFTGDGSTTDFTITFPYVNPNDLRVRTGTSPPYGSIPTSEFAPVPGNPQLIRFSPAPTEDFRLYRCTADSVIDATFQSGSAVRASDLNDNFRQLLYLSQESRAGQAGVLIDIDTDLDSKIDTVSPQDPIEASISGTALTISIKDAASGQKGSMSANDKTKLDGVSAATNSGITTTHTANSLTIGLDAATTSTQGAMSAADKTKLDSISVNSTQNATFAEAADSTRTAFTFSGTPDITSVWDLTISVNGVIQQPAVDYTYASNTVTFTSAPIVGSEMWCMIKGFRSATGDFFSSVTSSMVPLMNPALGLDYGSTQQDLNDAIVIKLELLDHLTDALDARLDAIRVAVADSTDFDSLKTRLLAILQ